ncbi:MAG: hypothetical protein MET45_28240 [Nostoc sp. LLA-1]|nr:hypothetical protein [Cyanocohniella sp. LLY]
MYNDEYYEERLNLSEAQIRRHHQKERFRRRNAELLQQELELEDELLQENPELAQQIHALNAAEIQAETAGFQDSFNTNSSKKSGWQSLFPGL